MSQVQSGSEAPAAALVGSLATFSLVDVLDLIDRTGQTGELQVIGRGIDRRIWLDRGDLIETDSPGTAEATLFELACIEEGWFYFTGIGVPEGGSRIAIGAVLTDLGPQAAEWRDLQARLPFDAVVAMSTSTPADEVQIRGDQWQLLSLVGSHGRTVHEVVDAAGGHPLDTLRTMRELADADLITVRHFESPAPIPTPVSEAAVMREEPVEPEPPLPPISSVTGSPATGPVQVEEPDASSTNGTTDRAPLPEPGPAEGWGAAPAAAAAPEPAPVPAVTLPANRAGTTGPLPPFIPPSPDPSEAPPPSPPAGWVERDEEEAPPPAEEPPPADESHASVMPPPISGDPWSSSLAQQTAADEET